MRKRILIVLSALMVCGLFAAVYAFNNINQAASSTCPMMHNQSAASATDEQKDSCCGMADCCKDGKCSMGGDCCKDKDSCPMKKQKAESKETAGDMNMSKVTFVGVDDAKDCCQKGADCCKGGGACCHKKS